MMQRHCLLLAIGLSCSAMLSVAVGQAAPPIPPAGAAAAVAQPVLRINDLPRDLKLKPSLTADDRQFIATFVATAIADLKNADPDKVKVGRESLIIGGSVAAPATISTDFAGKYAEIVSSALQNVLAGAKDLRTRLNVAVVAAKVAASTGSAKLEPVATVLLQDSFPIIRLWGARTAKAMMPELIRLSGHQALMGAVLKNVQGNPKGDFVREAYAVLTPDQVAQQAAPIVLQPLLGIAQNRINQFKAGLPDEPGIDYRPFMFLTQLGVWNQLKAQDQLAIAQMMCDLLCYGAIRADATPAQRDELADMLSPLAAAISVAAKQLPGPVAKSLDIAATRASTMARQRTNLVEAIREVPQLMEKLFPGLKAPPLPPPPAK